ncbi:M61 family metallopeptidase [Flammeovirga pacifica]|uniref:Peptidase M61 n=1 Tax=Flammeovirga pacifica TaxID=915059 RepID=A0A1S1YV74_FLAPC|nr:M61 family metallopeptidase [Flammeovirga pacifica]OHX64926.1 hypothetical protein NH26_00475 [Flammeovirga pacifica]
MHYHISPSLHPHYLHFKITFTAQTEDTLLRLPLWRPGRYQVQNFAKNIRGISASQMEEVLKLTTVGRNTWKVIGAKKGHQIEVSFDYYAQHKDAGGTWVSNDFWLINGIGCSILPEGLEQEAITLKLDHPKDFEVATNAKLSGGEYHFAHFEDWTESPLMLGRNMHHRTFEMDTIDFTIWIHGNVSPEWDKILTDFQKFTRVQLDIFGEFPHQEFHYLILVPDFKHYHGVEHHKNTVITLGPAAEFNTVEMYNNLLGVSCHELFHVWNVKQIRPKELQPYPLFQEAYFDTGYVAEGVTTYYGDEILYRSKAFDNKQYIKELNTLLTRHFENLGRHHLSVADSSLELWVDGYEKGVPQRKTSIYVKGALSALILDAKIKKKFSGEKSLDDIMRLMWLRFGKTSIGYTSADYQKIAEEVYEASLEDYFNEVIFGTAPLEEKVMEALAEIGFSTEVTSTTSDVLQYRFGIKLDGKGIVTDCEEISNGLIEGDKVVAINGTKGDKKLLNALSKEGNKLTITFIREEKYYTKDIEKKKELYFSKIYVSKCNE